MTLFCPTLFSMVREFSKKRRNLYVKYIASKYIHHLTHPPQELPHLHRLGSQNDRPKFKTKTTQQNHEILSQKQSPKYVGVDRDLKGANKSVKG